MTCGQIRAAGKSASEWVEVQHPVMARLPAAVPKGKKLAQAVEKVYILRVDSFHWCGDYP
jgi:hypothetical protein